MAFGNFKDTLCFFFASAMLSFAIAQTSTANGIYEHLDQFLDAPSPTALTNLVTRTASYERELTTNTEQLAWVILNCNIAYYYQQFGTIATAVEYYENAWKMYLQHQLSDYDIIENCLQPLGNAYLKLGDLPKAEQTILSYLYEADRTQNKPKIIAGITNISIAYHNRGAYDKAIALLQQGLQINPNNTNLLTNLATNYVAKGALRKAKKIANDLIQKDANAFNGHQILARIAVQEQKFSEAESHLLHAKTSYLKQPKASARGMVKIQLGYLDLVLRTQQYELALAAIQEAYHILLPKHTTQDDIPNRAPIADPILLKVLDIHAYVYTQMQHHHKALTVYELAFEVQEQLLLTYPLQQTQIQQQPQHRQRLEKYVALLYTLHTRDPKKRYGQKAFLAWERSKAPIVQAELATKQQLQAYQEDKLIKEKEQLLHELATYDTQILKEKWKGANGNVKKIQQWNTAHTTAAIALRNCVQRLRIRYPELYTSSPLTMERLKDKLLQTETTLLSYFYGNEVLYQCIVSAESFEMHQIPNDTQLQQRISKMIHAFDNASVITNDIRAYTQTAFDTYTGLGLDSLDIQENLLIIPDGNLHFIPFEALLTQPSTALNFQKMPFLVRSQSLHYAISATQFLNTTDTNDRSPSVFGIFPVFENTALELPFSLDEKQTIADQLSGDFLEKNNADYRTFTQASKAHPILHLSTHATAGTLNKPATLQFYDQEVMVNQLYGLHLNADLVVLSACETGVGRMEKGEGPMSIGRGFQYAGIPNVVVSLWKVNDRTTATGMGYFYSHLATGVTIKNALRQSKLDYLEDDTISNLQKSPYYWSAFSYYGSPTQHFTVSSYLWYGIGIICVGIIVFLLLFRKRL